MTGFDIFAGVVLLASALVGFVRGATREVVTVAAFVAGIVISIVAIRVSAPLAEHIIHTLWLARIAALVGVFLVVYVAVRLAGGALTRGVRRTALSGPDRVLGLAIGLVRGVVAIAVIALAIRAATPPERMPRWYTHALIFPEANAAGRILRELAPKGMALMRRAAPSVQNALTGENEDQGNADADDRSTDSATPGEPRNRSLHVRVEKAKP